MTVENRIVLAAAAIVCGGLLLAGTEAKACGNGKLLFEDKFDTLDPAWGKGRRIHPSDQTRVG